MGLHTKAFTAYACPPRAGVSGRYPIIPPVELSVIRTTVVVRPSAFYRWRTCRTGPELITGLTVTFGIGDQCSHELQDILLGIDIGKRVVMLRLLEIDRIEDLDHIRFIERFPMFVLNGVPLRIQHRSASFQGFSAFYKDTGFGIRYDIRAVHLKQVRFQPESRFTRAGSADDQHVLVPRIRRILRPVSHHQPFRSRQDHISLKDRIFIRLNVLVCSP